MASVLDRLKNGGIKLRLTPDGVLHIEVDTVAVTAASELKPVGTVDVYDVDLVQLMKDSQAVGTSAWHRLLAWIREKTGRKTS